MSDEFRYQIQLTDTKTGAYYTGNAATADLAITMALEGLAQAAKLVEEGKLDESA